MVTVAHASENLRLDFLASNTQNPIFPSFANPCFVLFVHVHKIVYKTILPLAFGQWQDTGKNLGNQNEDKVEFKMLVLASISLIDKSFVDVI